MRLSEVNTNSAEGRLLMAALAILTTSKEVNIKGFIGDGTKKTPDDMLDLVGDLSKEMYNDQAALPEYAMPKKRDLKRELTGVLNSFSCENASNTPDFVLAQFMLDTLSAFNTASQAREKWYGKRLTISGVEEIPDNEGIEQGAE